jgi:hypothetical protein
VKSTLSLLCLCLLVGFTIGQTKSVVLQPTPLEAFARMPATHVAWSKEVGRIETDESRAIVTALILEDTAQPPDRMRGIRIELSSGDSKDEIFLGEETLRIYKEALDQIATEAIRQRNAGNARENLTPDGTAYVGAEVFWYGYKTASVHALNAAHYFAPNSSGLYLSAFKDVGFKFPNQDASQLSVVLERAIKELNEH